MHVHVIDNGTPSWRTVDTYTSCIMVELDVSVRIIYDGEKKRIVSDTSFQTAIDTLKSDLLRLKIPHPKAENVNIIYPGCIQFSWRTQRNSTLHRQLKQRVRPESREITDVLHISTMRLQERSGTRNFARRSQQLIYI